MVEKIYTGNLHHLPLRMLKVFLVIIDNFNLQFFFVRQPLLTDIFHIDWNINFLKIFKTSNLNFKTSRP